MVRGFNTRLIKREPRSAANTTPTTLEEFATDVFAPAFSQEDQLRSQQEGPSVPYLGFVYGLP
jgi:hypothetical protein